MLIPPNLAAFNPAVSLIEAAAPGLKTFLFVLIGVLLVIFGAIAYLTSTTHTRKLSYVEKTVFDLLWVAAPSLGLLHGSAHAKVSSR